jgi:hypothetical protein
MKEQKCYSSINYKINEEKVWYNQYRGYIVKSWIDKNTNLIQQKKIPYNQPNNFINFLNNYFTNRIN